MLRKSAPESIMKEKWIADFSKPEKSCFDIKPEIAYDAYLDNGSLALALKKTNCIAWLETQDRHYEDQVIEARLRLDSLGGYAAAGIMFRIIESGVYYSATVSGRGYFRLDVVRNNAPTPLIGWTEAPVSEKSETSLTIIALGGRMIFLINGRWIAEANDDSISGGHLGFSLVSYEAAERGEAETEIEHEAAGLTCRAWLDFLSVDSRLDTVDEYYQKWNDSEEIPAESRLRLAEAMAAVGAAAPALTQIVKAWERRELAARSVSATYTEMRTRRELVFAAKMAFQLGQYAEAEEYIQACMDEGDSAPAGTDVYAEKAKILSAQQKYDELKNFMPEYIARKGDDPSLYALLGHAHFCLNEYGPAAAAWDKAFSLNSENGLYAINAANAWELVGKKDEALQRRLAGGRLFLRQDNYDELGALIPKLISTESENWEARALAGKWAFGIEDYTRAENELRLADEARQNLKPRPDADPAVSYLRGMLMVRENRQREAFVWFEEAAGLAPDYGLFRLKLAETRYALSGNAHEPQLAADLAAVQSLMPDDEYARSFVEQIEAARAASPPPLAPPVPAPAPQKRRAAAAKPKPAKKAAPSKKSVPKAKAAPKTKPAAAPAKKTTAKVKPAAPKAAAGAKKAALSSKAKIAGKAAEQKKTAKTAATPQKTKKTAVKTAAHSKAKTAQKKQAGGKKPATKKAAAAGKTKAASRAKPAAGKKPGVPKSAGVKTKTTSAAAAVKAPTANKTAAGNGAAKAPVKQVKLNTGYFETSSSGSPIIQAVAVSMREIISCAISSGVLPSAAIHSRAKRR
jgi:uncharacterized protein HemY